MFCQVCNQAMVQKKAKSVLESTLNRLVSYTLTHFTTEENYFSKTGYPDTGAHKSEHAGFVQKVSEFKKGFDSGRLLVSIEIMNFLVNWVTAHIKNSDKKYSGHLRANGIT